ncbi:MAG: SUMF1/EgtB/PvdO family nonheme iron enzyme [Methyloprofundus sp.]|nr:SUMF1/EgtB/PvdO family nonheme iron enzyme [Methyloprofundus sp.]
MIKTAKQQWQIKCITCPDFAQNIGQDQRGLFIETELNNSDKRYYWLPEQVDEQGQKQAGAWFPERQVGENIGRDQYGLYRDVSINKIMQRFRYIQPGCFLMGSPEGELERELWDGKETQHQVTLTEGFWLADTAVTQALYQAVMSENLRRFKNDLNHPVEQVSWDNVQQFIKKLKTIMPALHAQLPTEAQWEYACRAGTLTPFSFGDNISLEQVNYDGKGPYAEGKKGKKRNKTVVVKSLLENAWGLYEMHGNVWEWCTDKHQEDLGDAATIDPIGGEDGSFRVLRGGSWFSSGGSTRSAYRRRLQPDERYFRIGFRLVLGHQFQTEKEKGS